jgi:tRNA 2-selenouridine synthase
MRELIHQAEFENLVLKRAPILDVRASVEFNEGHIPHSQCLPILNDDERTQVGTTYKNKGQEAAIALGNELVCGEIKQQRIDSWVQFLNANEDSVLTCFRGGLRSKTAQAWIAERNFVKPRIDGGYKAFRQYLIEQIETLSNAAALTVVSGTTGSAKTHLLTDLTPYRSVLDLEGLANHRGSAFGNLGPQPAQPTFENQLAYELIGFSKKAVHKIVVEDESRLIGRCVIPDSLFENLRAQSLIVISENMNVRVENIFKDYISSQTVNDNLFQKFQAALSSISRRLGGLRFEEIKKDLCQSFQDWQLNGDLDSNRVWIEKLLKYYYDPLYLSSREKRNPKIVFSGTRPEVFEYLKSQADEKS